MNAAFIKMLFIKLKNQGIYPRDISNKHIILLSFINQISFINQY